MITGESGDVVLDKLPLKFSVINSGRILWIHLTSDPSQIVTDTPESVVCVKWVKIGILHILHAIIFSYLRMSDKIVDLKLFDLEFTWLIWAGLSLEYLKSSSHC